MNFEFPFLTREMLKFDHGTQIKLSVKYRTFEAVTFTVRGATRSGLFSHTVIAGINQNETESLVALPDIPIWVNISTPAQIVTNNVLYAQIAISLNGSLAYTLCAGYINDSRSMSWPSTNLKPPQPDTFGYHHLLNVASPGAGAEWSSSLGPYNVSRLRFMQFTLTTSATVANRRVHIGIDDNAGGFMEIASGTDQLLSQARVYSVCAIGGAPTFADDNDILIPWPAGLVLGTDTIIRSKTVNLQAGDQFSAITVNTEKWFGYAE